MFLLGEKEIPKEWQTDKLVAERFNGYGPCGSVTAPSLSVITCMHDKCSGPFLSVECCNSFIKLYYIDSLKCKITFLNNRYF